MSTVIAPVVPRSVGPRGGIHQSSGRRRAPLPLASVPAPRTVSTVYAVAAIDCNGRVADRVFTQVLGWPAGTALALVERAGVIVVEADETGSVEVANPGQIRVPAPVRHRLGLVPGTRLLLAADPARAKLVMYPPAAVDGMVTAFQAAALGGEGR